MINSILNFFLSSKYLLASLDKPQNIVPEKKRNENFKLFLLIFII